MTPQNRQPLVSKRTDPSFRLRLPKPVLKAITAEARKNGRSRNSEIVVALARYVGEQRAVLEQGGAKA